MVNNNNDNLIICENLTKKYNEHIVVDNFNLTVKRGEIFGLLGPNGAGKSTIILMILGLTEPTSGSVFVGGFNSTKEPLKVKRITGYLPEKVGFYEDMTARGNLEYTAELNNIPYSEIPKKIDEVLEIVDLLKYKNSLVKTFSKGMKQRLGIADVLIKDPQLIIFDELTEGLDIAVANQILQTILDLNKQKNITFLLSSHQLNLIQRICTRVGILSKGKLIGEGSIDSLGREMFGGGKFSIEVELEKIPDGIIDKLKKLDKVVNVIRNENQIRVVCDKDIRQDISKLIASEGILLTRMDIKQDALEEIYLKYFKEE
ncbi:MAG: ABC transporter ATP-binding protein [Candidatus Humimicrobiaceae bacterium]|jgi:ABC-2 type transport system ATP-binding protein|nr:ABC transporter ATP-binding protein [Actinomycetota bacterium]MDD5600502.1 ABC transporter ATP-binding protein [Actinomycetota bacterium]MDY0028109.1 ABC transporter ATP-binding protein [Candidatus Humimicrobiaceae bacterium]